MNKPIKYIREDYEGMIVFGCDTDFSKYDYAPGITLYKKGWFRNYEKFVVVKTRDIMNQSRETLNFFDTQKEGMQFIRNLINKLKGGARELKLEHEDL